MKWIVTINRPYYPDVEYYEDWEEAFAAYRELHRDAQEPGGGKYEVKVTIALVTETTLIETEY